MPAASEPRAFIDRARRLVEHVVPRPFGDESVCVDHAVTPRGTEDVSLVVVKTTTPYGTLCSYVYAVREQHPPNRPDLARQMYCRVFSVKNACIGIKDATAADDGRIVVKLTIVDGNRIRAAERRIDRCFR